MLPDEDMRRIICVMESIGPAVRLREWRTFPFPAAVLLVDWAPTECRFERRRETRDATVELELRGVSSEAEACWSIGSISSSSKSQSSEWVQLSK